MTESTRRIAAGAPGGATARRAVLLAHQIQADILTAGLLPSSLFASEQEMRTRYGVGTGALREAIRILELREAGRMRRGPGGGFVVMLPTERLVAQALTAYLCVSGTTARHVLEARHVVATVATKLASGSATKTRRYAPGHIGAVDSERRGLLPTWRSPLLADQSGNIVLRLLAECVDRLADLVPARQGSAQIAGASPDDTAPLTPTVAPSRRIEVAHKRAGQIARNIITGLIRDRLEPGVRLGSEADVCKRYRISKSTARQIIVLLEETGLVRCRRGRRGGVFVQAPSGQVPRTLICSFLRGHGVTRHEAREVALLLATARLPEHGPCNPFLDLVLDSLRMHSAGA